jgi:hypothetical protein
MGVKTGGSPKKPKKPKNKKGEKATAKRRGGPKLTIKPKRK